MKNPHDQGKVMVFGTFDIFHKGHIHFLNQAKKLGKYLIVVVARDKNVQKIKGKLPQNKEKTRVREIIKNKIADRVVLGNLRNRYLIIGKYKPEVIALGYDQQVDMKELRKYLGKINLAEVKIKKLPAFKPSVYKSSKLKEKSRLLIF